MGGKKPLRRPLWPPTRATASNYYPLGLDGAGGAAKPLLRAPKKPAPLHGRLPAFSGAVDAFERARKCFLEWHYFFSIILSEFLKNRVALHRKSREIIKYPEKEHRRQPAFFRSSDFHSLFHLFIPSASAIRRAAPPNPRPVPDAARSCAAPAPPDARSRGSDRAARPRGNRGSRRRTRY